MAKFVTYPDFAAGYHDGVTGLVSLPTGSADYMLGWHLGKHVNTQTSALAALTTEVSILVTRVTALEDHNKLSTY